MSEGSTSDEPAKPWEHTPAFRRRRALNWVPLGATYAFLYTGRYNFTVTNVSIACERHWEIKQISLFVTVGLAVYACSTFLNGPLADRFGGRRAILIAAAGAGIANLVFPIFAGTAPLALLLVGWGINNYFQSFGALSVVKVNAAWFHLRERGAFSGIFGTMIQSGRWLVLSLGGVLLAAFGWRSLYFVPGCILLGAFVVDYIFVRDTPEAASLPKLDTGDETAAEQTQPATLRFVLRKIFASRVAWMIAGANFCTGFVRHGIEQYWFVFYRNVYHFDTRSIPYQLVANLGFVAGLLGSMTAGLVSDRFFGSRRGPVASIWYMGQAMILVAFSLVVPAVPAVLSHSNVTCGVVHGFTGGTIVALVLAITATLVVLNFVVANTRSDWRLVIFGAQVLAIVALGVAWPSLGTVFAHTSQAAVATIMIVLLQFFVGGAHGLLAGTASMDYGGKRAAATAAGFFDGVQYLAGSIGGVLLGTVLQRHGWSWWIPTIAPFAVVGAALMASLWRSMPTGSQPAH